jgi:PqqD family protein of HPr-rel-A system
MSILKRLALNEEGFLFDPTTGDSFLLNASGLVLLRGVQEGLDEAHLTARLVERFAVDPEQAARDVDDFLVQLRVLRWL